METFALEKISFADRIRSSEFKALCKKVQDIFIAENKRLEWLKKDQYKQIAERVEGLFIYALDLAEKSANLAASAKDREVIEESLLKFIRSQYDNMIDKELERL